MKQYEDLLRRILGILGKPRFRTSFEVVARVMGVPMAAVEALAREAGIVQGEWIDEDSLVVFEDAYIRKLKVYFKRMMRNADEMGCDDLRTFINFCETFKKPNVETSKICRWEDIDEDAIREQFRADVEEYTPNEPLHEQFECVPLCMVCPKGFESRSLDSQLEIKNITNHNAQIQVQRKSVLRAVTSSLAYRTGLRRCKKAGQRETEHKAFIVTAHYYIYCREDKEDHHVDTLRERRPYRVNLSINSTLMKT